MTGAFPLFFLLLAISLPGRGGLSHGGDGDQREEKRIRSTHARSCSSCCIQNIDLFPNKKTTQITLEEEEVEKEERSKGKRRRRNYASTSKQSEVVAFVFRAK